MTVEMSRARSPGATETASRIGAEAGAGVEAAAGTGVVARWRTLPDFLAATLRFGRRQDCAAGPDRTAPLELERGSATDGAPAAANEPLVLTPTTTAHAPFATPEARARGFPPVRLVRARCVLRRGERRCAATCPPGAVVVAGGPDGATPPARVEASGPAGAGAWAIDLRAPADGEGEGEPAPVAVWAMCM